MIREIWDYQTPTDKRWCYLRLRPQKGFGARTRGLGQEMGSSPPDRASPTPNCSWKRELDSEFILVVTIDFDTPVEDQWDNARSAKLSLSFIHWNIINSLYSFSLWSKKGTFLLHVIMACIIYLVVIKSMLYIRVNLTLERRLLSGRNA